MSERKLVTRKIPVKLNGGKSITIPAWEMKSGKPGPCLLLTAAQHGNEVQGAEAIRRFMEKARRELACGKVFAVPMVNLPAIRERRPHARMKAEQAYADCRGYNMNRWWPGKANGNDAARIPSAIYRAFGEESTHLFDLHCWPRHRAPGLLVFDTPEVKEMAAALGHRFVYTRPLPKAGKFSNIRNFFGSTGRTAVTYEFSGQYVIKEEQVRHGLRLLVNFARYIGLMEGSLRKIHSPVLFPGRYRKISVKTTLSGLFVESGHELCGRVEKGEKLGHVISDTRLECREILSPETGYLFSYGANHKNPDVTITGHHPYVKRNEIVACLAVAEQDD